MNEDGIIWVILLIMGITVISMIMVVVAGDFHEMGSTEKTENFGVTNPSVQRACDLQYLPVETLSVRYYNGTAWKTLTTSDYTLSGSTLTVKASAMD